jgi:hypothetical protein
LKGCGRKFQPRVPSSRYCSSECREKARQWRNRRAQERYRQTAKGKATRRKQAHVRRQKLKDRICDESGTPTVCVGDHNESNEGHICARPGCYERVTPTRRSPCQKYCNHDCCSAMRCVTERERRWQERLRERHRLSGRY